MATKAAPKQQLDPTYDHYDYPTVSPNVQSGHPGHTSPEQDAQVFQLRMMLEAEGFKDRLDTLTMLRFLRARKFDVNLSKQMFVESEKWRKEFGGGVDALVPGWDYPEKKEIFEYYPQYYHKTDKDGRPVYIEHLGKIDLVAMRAITTDERMLENLVVEYEKLADPRLPACSRKSGFLLETCCTIMDAKGVSIGSVPSVYGYLKSAAAISQNYYPERLGKLYIINAPWGFSSVFRVVKAFLDPVTVAKIHILGGDYLPKLLEQVPAENLPHSLGGECRCEGGCALSDQGPWQETEWVRTPAWAPKSDAAPKAPAESEADKKEEAEEAGKETSEPSKAAEEAVEAAPAEKAPAAVA